MQIRNLVLGSAAILTLAMTVGGFAAYSNINTVRIGGPLQTRSQEASDLIADILPPPEYVIEPFLETTLILNDPSSIARRAPRLAALRAQYDDRHRHWLQSSLDDSVRKKVSVGTHGDAMRFWQELETRFLPATRARDTARMAASYRRLSAAYAAHRQHIDAAVTAATKLQGDLTQDARTQLHRSLTILALVALAILAGVGGFCLLILRRVVSPLSVIATTMKRMAGGDLHVAIVGEGRQDEIGDVARAMAGFRVAEAQKAAMEQAAHRRQADQEHVVATLGRGLQRLADGDLTDPIVDAMPADYEVLRDNYNRALGSLGDLMQAITASATTIDTGSAEIATASEDLARRTETTAAKLQEAASALNTVNDRLKKSTSTAQRTVARADETIAIVSTGRDLAGEATRAMSRVSESAKGIDSVIEGLDKIAFQTRVLAMNAAVEAGRSGEAGRGFAVVADLVGALAKRSEQEAQQARRQLTATQSDIFTAVDTVSRVDNALHDISGEVEEVHDMLADMAADNRTQSIAVSEVSAAIGSMDNATQQNAAMVEQTSAAARNLTFEVAALNRGARSFTISSATADARIAA